MAKNVENQNNEVHHDPFVAQVHQQLVALQRQVAGDNAAPLNPIRNLHAYRGVANPAVENRINANNFELNQGLIQRAETNAFGGRAVEDPNEHLSTFIQVSNTVKLNGVPDDEVRLKLFPFSLRGATRDWYKRLKPNSIQTWNDMVILLFMIKPHESMRDAWE